MIKYAVVNFFRYEDWLDMEVLADEIENILEAEAIRIDCLNDKWSGYSPQNCQVIQYDQS